MSLTIGELFSGVNGFGLGFARAGFDVKWCVELEDKCRMVTRRHWPEAKLFGDITKVKASDLEPVDVITFGSPCTDLSVAGKRGGLYAERSGLFFEAIRIIKALKPRFCIWENVFGALSSYSGDTPEIGDVLSDPERWSAVPEESDLYAALDAIRECGPRDIGWCVLDSQWFGVPQRRRRIFAIGDLGGNRGPEILSLAESLSGHPEPRRETGQEIAGTLGGGAQSGGFRTTDLDNSGAFVVDRPGLPNTAWCLQERDAKGVDSDTKDGHLIMEALAFNARQDPGVSENVYEPLSASSPQQQAVMIIPFDTTQVTSKLNYSNPKPGDPCHPLAVGQHVPAVAYQCQGSNVGEAGTLKGDDVQRGVPFVFEPRLARNGRGAPEEVCPPLKAESGQTGKGDGAPHVVVSELEPLTYQYIIWYIFEYANAIEADASEVLRLMWREVRAQKTPLGRLGGIVSFLTQEILQSDLHGEGIQGEVQGKREAASGTRPRKNNGYKNQVRTVRNDESAPGRTPQGRRSAEQSPVEPSRPMSLVPYEKASRQTCLCDLWKTPEGAWILQQALSQIQEIRRSRGAQNPAKEDVLSLRSSCPCRRNVRQALYADKEEATEGGCGANTMIVRRLTPL